MDAVNATHVRAYDHVHNIFRFFDGWANSFTTSETKRDYQ